MAAAAVALATSTRTPLSPLPPSPRWRHLQVPRDGGRASLGRPAPAEQRFLRDGQPGTLHGGCRGTVGAGLGQGWVARGALLPGSTLLASLLVFNAARGWLMRTSLTLLPASSASSPINPQVVDLSSANRPNTTILASPGLAELAVTAGLWKAADGPLNIFRAFTADGPADKNANRERRVNPPATPAH